MSRKGRAIMVADPVNLSRGGRAAMPQKHIEDLIEILDLEPQIETGNDDFVFGNYVEFPSASQIDRALIPEVLNLLGVPLPFERAVEASFLAWLPNLDSATRTLVLEALGEPEISTSERGEFLLTFQNLTASSEKVLELVDLLMPSTLYEEDLADDLRYWQPDPEYLYGEPDDELLDLFGSRPVDLNTLIFELKSLRDTFAATHDSTVQKAILLACFSLVESFTHQRSLQNAPRFPDSPDVERLIRRLLTREIRDDGKRKQVVNTLEPEKTWQRRIPGWELRNALSHDIGGVVIAYGEASFEGQKPETPTQMMSIESVFRDLIEYANSNLR